MEKSSRRGKTSQNTSTEISTFGSDGGLKRKQAEIEFDDANESGKLTPAVEDNRSEAEEVRNGREC